MTRPEENLDLFLHLISYLSPALATWLGFIIGGIITVAVILGITLAIVMTIYDAIKAIRVNSKEHKDETHSA